MAKTKRTQPVIKNPNRSCCICEKKYMAVAPLQKTCSIECRVKLYASYTKDSKGRDPEIMKQYNKNRKEKNPNVWKDRARKNRETIIESLGGKCVVESCLVSNNKWLHVDYIPTMKGTGFRHPRHIKWVMDNIHDFRLLCANHHYELTTTGQIEGTNIIQ